MLIMSKPKKSDRHLAKRLTLRLPDREGEMLKQLAKRNDRTITAELLRAVRRHLEAEGFGEKQ